MHSTVIGGSNAARIINCPASVAAIAALPPALIDDKPSSYATEGTACHIAIAHMILNDAPMPLPGTLVEVKNEGHVEITQELIHDCLQPAWEHYLSLLERAGPDAEVCVEEQVRFPGVDGAFGTCDLIIKAPSLRATFIRDWKFGAGVPVAATYEHPSFPGELTVNEQLLFYGTAAAFTIPDLFFEDGVVDIGIVQPRVQDERARISIVDDIRAVDLKVFADVVESALNVAELPDAPRLRGHWCRFAPCRVTCPLWLNPMNGLSLEAVDRPAATQMAPDYVAAVLAAAPLVEGLIEAAREQARALLEAGTPVPGWKLVPKRANRQWVFDEPTLRKALRKLGLLKASIYEAPKLKSPAQIEKLIGKNKLPEGAAAAFSSGTTLAPEADHRPSIKPLGKLIASLDASGLLDSPTMFDDKS